MIFENEEQERRNLIEAFHNVFSTDDGKKVLNNLKYHCCIDALTIYGPDMVFNEGKRYVANYIKYMMELYKKEIAHD